MATRNHAVIEAGRPQYSTAPHPILNRTTLSPEWRTALQRIGTVWLLLVLLFWSEWAAMAVQWWDISTYNHILLVPVILVWLVLLRWPDMVILTPVVWWPGLLLFAGAAMAWFAGHLASVNALSQFASVGMLQASAMVLLGPKVCASLLFPLGYMLLLVPIGEELVPLLQTITAKMTIALTVWSNIPAQIDGVFINTPAGLFEVAEECSGVKFLIAMLAFAVFVANLSFQSTTRRAVFLSAALILPILANAVRAWGTIYLAQIYGSEAAGGVDHLIYGWVFFALLLVIVMGIAWRYSDRPIGAGFVNLHRIQSSRLLSWLASYNLRPNLTLAAMAWTILLVTGWAMLAQSLMAPVASRLNLPEVPGWQGVAYVPQVTWYPQAFGADKRALASYRNSKGGKVDVFYALYASQTEGSEATGYGQGALVPDSLWRWHSDASSRGEGATKAEWLRADGTTTMRLAETFYRTGSNLTQSAARLKVLNFRDRALLSAQPTALLILSVEGDTTPDGKHSAQARLESFRQALGLPLRWMDEAGFYPSDGSTSDRRRKSAE